MWKYNGNSYYFQCPKNANPKIKECYIHLFNQYKIIQDKLALKFPYSSNLKVAKIKNITDQVDEIKIEFYYDGLNGEQVNVNYISNEEKIEEGFKQAIPLKNHYDELKYIDVPMMKQVLQCLIEIFHWSANFGIFFDAEIQYLLFLKQPEKELFVLIPNFVQITNYFFEGQAEFSAKKFSDFRKSDYQKKTYEFILEFLKEFYQQVKPQDEDQTFYIYLQQQDNLQKGVDYLFGHDGVKKKMWRYTFKQSMILYQLSTCQELRENYKNHKKIDAKQLNNKQNTQSQNLLDFLDKLKIDNSQSNDILTFFAEKMAKFYNKNLEINQDCSQLQKEFRPNWKPPQNKNIMDKIENNKQNNDQNQQIFEYNWISQMDQQNIFYLNAQQKTMDQSSKIVLDPQQKYFFMKHRFELLENKNCYIIRTTLNEIIFSIDTADDIMFLVNVIQKETGSTNLYVDDTRRLTLYTSIVMGQKIEIIASIIKILDLHQIYYFLILDFYQKNIQNGRSVRELKYQHFVREIQHYVQDYEKDFEDQMKNIQDKIYIGF